METQNRKIESRLTKMETLMENTREDIRSIKNNHLTKIYDKVEEIEKKMYAKPGWQITILSSIVVGLTVYLLTR